MRHHFVTIRLEPLQLNLFQAALIGRDRQFGRSEAEAKLHVGMEPNDRSELRSISRALSPEPAKRAN
jgi:hypothetical protein